MPQQYARHHRNEDATIRVAITNPDGSAYDLTGAQARLCVKEFATDTDANAKIRKTTTSASEAVIVAPATAGIVDFFILPADSAALGLETAVPAVTYFLGVKIKSAATKYYTVVDGKYALFQPLVENF
jgi:LysM repeat protein